MDELNKIDLIRERMGVSYREAKEAIEEAGGDLVEALIKLEERTVHGWSDQLHGKGEAVVDSVKTYIKKGNRTKIRLKKGEKTLAEFPVTIGAIGIVAALASTPVAIAAGVGAVAALANKVSMEIQKPDGETKVVSLEKHRNSREDENVDF